MNNLLAFDLEIAKEIPTITIERNGETIEVSDDFNKHRPLGITCVAVKAEDHHPAIVTAHSMQYALHYHEWRLFCADNFEDKMTSRTARWIVDTLIDSVKNNGMRVLTWNGQFDFHTLAEESGMWDECIDIALNHHIDLMFEVFCRKGWRVSLASALAGMGLDGKTAGMDGAKAPQVWKTDPLKVIQYVNQDANAMMALANAIRDNQGLQWYSGSGKHNMLPFDRLRTVRECLELPVIDNSWMDVPVTRESFFEWIGDKSPFAQEAQ